MRENSGQGDATNNNLDPTLDENAGKGGTGRRPGDFTEGAPLDVAADKEQPGGKRSPSSRGRGEVSAGDHAAPIDLD